MPFRFINLFGVEHILEFLLILSHIFATVFFKLFIYILFPALVFGVVTFCFLFDNINNNFDGAVIFCVFYGVGVQIHKNLLKSFGISLNDMMSAGKTVEFRLNLTVDLICSILLDLNDLSYCFFEVELCGLFDKSV